MADTPSALLALNEAAGDAGQADPVRLRYLQALAARLPQQPPAVRQVLAQRLEQGVADYLRRAPRREPALDVATEAPPALSPLAQLNRELAARAQSDAQRARSEGQASTSELRSVRQFGELWSRIAAHQQVRHAQHRAPPNAGPLHPHKLMLQSLALMQELSPDYLRRFVAHAQALVAVEQINEGPVRAPLRPGRARKPRN